MAYSPLTPSIYVGVAPSYFTDIRPDALMGRLQSVTLTEGVDANRPFQRFRNSRLDFEIIISAVDAGERPYQAGQLVWLEVAAGAGVAEVWFKGLLRDPDYDVRRSGRSSVRMTAIDVSDVFKETISVASQSANTIAENIGLLLDGVGWPDDADWRDIDADLIEQLSTWEHTTGRAISGLQELADTTGPPARMVIKRNGGLQVLKDVSDTVEYSFDDSDVRSRPVVRQHEDSVINTVTIEGTTLGSLSSTVRNRRPLEYDVLDGLASAERVNVIRRILRAYENGLTSLTQEMPADDDRNQADVLALRPGTVIEQDSDTLGQTYQGSISSLRWQWRRTRATVRVNAEITPPVSEVFGARLYFTFFDDDDPNFEHNRLFLIDAETGVATQIDVGEPGSLEVISALAYDPNNDILYGISQDDSSSPQTGDLVRINTSTGVGTVVGALPNIQLGMKWAGMAYDHEHDILYGIGNISQTGGLGPATGLYAISTADASHTQVGPFGLGIDAGGIRSLAYVGRDTLVTVEQRVQAGQYTTINRITGMAARIGPVQSGLALVGGLAYDNNNLRLFGVSEWLLDMDVSSGVPTRIGTVEDFGVTLGAGREGTGTGLAYMSLGRVLNMPTGLSLAESGGDITATWDPVPDATEYILEWREEGSGAAWQTANVSAPPHTFTP